MNYETPPNAKPQRTRSEKWRGLFAATALELAYQAERGLPINPNEVGLLSTITWAINSEEAS